MRRIRAVIVTVSPLLRDIVSEVVAGRVPIDFVAALASRDRLEVSLRDLTPHLILIGLRRGEGCGVALALRSVFPCARVILLSHDARQADVHGPHHNPIALLDLSAEALTRAVLGF